MYRDVVHSKAETKSFAMVESGGAGDSGESTNAADANTLIVRKTKPGRRNKPGMEVSAIRNSQSKTNMENGALVASKTSKSPSKIICYRCGKDDHTLKQCPLPFQPKLAFAPARNNTTKRTVLSNDQTDGCEDVIGDEKGEGEHDREVETEAAPLFGQVHIATEEEERDWVASWLEKSDLVMAFDADYAEVFLSGQNPIPISSTGAKFIVDSGASSTVCGKQWLVDTANQFNFSVPTEWMSSDKTFRFWQLIEVFVAGKSDHIGRDRWNECCWIVPSRNIIYDHGHYTDGNSLDRLKIITAVYACKS